jgi:hypothetical protein
MASRGTTLVLDQRAPQFNEQRSKLFLDLESSAVVTVSKAVFLTHRFSPASDRAPEGFSAAFSNLAFTVPRLAAIQAGLLFSIKALWFKLA